MRFSSFRLLQCKVLFFAEAARSVHKNQVKPIDCNGHVHTHQASTNDDGTQNYVCTINVRYVRRELRSLTDREARDFFSALRKFYTLSLEEGRREYGDTWANSNMIAATYASQVCPTSTSVTPQNPSPRRTFFVLSPPSRFSQPPTWVVFTFKEPSSFWFLQQQHIMCL